MYTYSDGDGDGDYMVTIVMVSDKALLLKAKREHEDALWAIHEQAKARKERSWELDDKALAQYELEKEQKRKQRTEIKRNARDPAAAGSIACLPGAYASAGEACAYTSPTKAKEAKEVAKAYIGMAHISVSAFYQFLTRFHVAAAAAAKNLMAEIAAAPAPAAGTPTATATAAAATEGKIYIDLTGTQ
jgi:hypothetical protein